MREKRIYDLKIYDLRLGKPIHLQLKIYDLRLGKRTIYDFKIFDLRLKRLNIPIAEIEYRNNV